MRSVCNEQRHVLDQVIGLEVGRLRGRLQANCDLLCSWIDGELQCPYVRPQGAFYLMLSVENLKQDSLSVALDLLKDGVVTVPGSAFGSEGEGYLRLSFACRRDRLAEGMSRLKKGLRRISRSKSSHLSC